MSIDRSAAALLIALPIAFNSFFFLLGRQFGYPGVLRQPVGVVLSRFHAGGPRLKLTWYGFTLTAVLLAPLAVLLGPVLARDGLEIVPAATPSASRQRSSSSSGWRGGLSSFPRLPESTKIPSRPRRLARPLLSSSTPSTVTWASLSASASATS